MTDTARFNLRYPAELREPMDRVCEKLDRSLNWIVVEALRQYLRRQGEEVEK